MFSTHSATGWNQGAGCTEFSSGGYRKSSIYKLMFIGRIQVFVIIGLRSMFMCSLWAGSDYQFLKASSIIWGFPASSSQQQCVKHFSNFQSLTSSYFIRSPHPNHLCFLKLNAPYNITIHRSEIHHIYNVGGYTTGYIHQEVEDLKKHLRILPVTESKSILRDSVTALVVTGSASEKNDMLLYE